MRNESQTLIATILHHVTAWRKSEGWSRETVVQAIVEAHERISGPVVTGINFDPNTKDTFERMKVNADRVYRWLDDSTKDTNLLPANFIPSILEAMPIDIRVNCMNDMFRGVGVAIKSIERDPGTSLNAVGMLQNIITENSQAQHAVADLVDGATKEELIRAHKELSESVRATQNALQSVESALSVCQ